MIKYIQQGGCVKTSHWPNNILLGSVATMIYQNGKKSSQNVDKNQSLETITKTQKQNENVLKFNHS